MLTRGLGPRMLTEVQVRNVVTTFEVEWDQ